MRLLQGITILIAVVLLIFTIVPERPSTGLQHGVEHFGAFGLFGILFAASFQTKTSLLLLAGACYALILECLQIPLPTRHARLEDLVVDAIAICLGIVLVRVCRICLPQFQS